VRELANKQLRRVWFHEQARFEVEPRRQTLIGVRRPRETIDAAVLAAAVRVDRTVKADVGRFIACDDLPRPLFGDVGLERRKLFETLPAVVERDLGLRFIASARVGHGAAPAPTLTADSGIDYAVLRLWVISRLRRQRFVKAPIHRLTLLQP